MDAWSRERHTSIECRLAMEEAGRLLREFLKASCLPPRLRKRAKRMVRVIDTCAADADGGAPDEE